MIIKKYNKKQNITLDKNKKRQQIQHQTRTTTSWKLISKKRLHQTKIRKYINKRNIILNNDKKYSK